MREFVGLTHLGRIDHSLKREALIMARIGIYDFKGDIRALGNDIDDHLRDEVEWLLERDIAFDLDPSKLKTLRQLSGVPSFARPEVLEELERYFGSDAVNRLQVMSDSVMVKGDVLRRLAVQGKRDELIAIKNRATSVRHYLTDIQARAAALRMRESEGVDIFPFFYAEELPKSNRPTSQGDIIRIVMNALPIPSERTSWEEILEYRSDPDSFGKFLALRRWMMEVAKAQLSPREIEDQLEWLVYDFQRHIELHRLKAGMGTLETIVTVGSEFLEDLVKVNWGNAAKLLFTFQHRKVDLMEAEMKAPGSEVAYILKSREEFERS